MDSVDVAVGSTLRLEDLYSTHRLRVFNLCRYLLGSSEAAQDATQEVFLRAQERFSTYDPSRPVSSWLTGIASHYCVDLLRRRGVEKRLFEPDLTGEFQGRSLGRGPLGQLLRAERGEAVRDALARVPDQYRIPLVLAYYSELSYEEIGAVLGLGRNTVGTLIFRGKKLLRQQLSGERTRGLSK